MSFFMKFICCLLSCSFCKAIPIQYLSTDIVSKINHANLATAVKEVIAKVFGGDITTVNIIIKSTFDHFVNDFQDDMLSEEIVYRIETVSDIQIIPLRHRRCSVFIIDTIEDFIVAYEILTPKRFSSRGYYLIVLLHGEIKEIRDIFGLLWKAQIYNVLLVHDAENDSVYLKTFFPFKPGRCGDVTPMIIGTFEKTSLTVHELFPGKMNNLHNCSIRIALGNTSQPNIFAILKTDGSYDLKGIEIRLLNTVSKSLNFRVNYTFIGPEGSFYENGTTDGPLKLLLEGNADLSLSNWWLKPNRIQFFDTTLAYTDSKVVFIVPPGRDLNALEKIVFPFSRVLWMVIIFYWIVSILVILLIRSQKKEVRNFVFGTDVRQPLLNMHIGLVGGTQHKLPKRNFARFLLMMFLLYSLVIRTLYQGAYFHLIQSHQGVPEVQSIEDMIAKDFKISFAVGNFDLLEGIEAINQRLVKRNTSNKILLTDTFFNFRSYPITSEEANQRIEIIQRDPNFKGAHLQSQFKTIYYNQIVPKELRLKMCREPLFTIQIVMYMKKNFYLLRALNGQIEYLKASGFINFWHHEFIDQRILHEKKPSNPRAITFHDLTGSFEILLIGIIISLIVLITELLRFHRPPFMMKLMTFHRRN